MNKNSQSNIKIMFDKISDHYDVMNWIISFGLHKIIKNKSVDILDLKENSKVLDVCCGTGDMCEIIAQKTLFSNIIGVDFSQNMLNKAKAKLPQINFIMANAEELPFGDSSFDAVISSFGFRNVQNKSKMLDEIYRVLKPNGKFLHLDFGKKNMLNTIFNLLTPVLSTILKQDLSSYKYLVDSKKNFPEPRQLINQFIKHNFKLFKRKDFLFGAISTQIMQKSVDD